MLPNRFQSIYTAKIKSLITKQRSPPTIGRKKTKIYVSSSISFLCQQINLFVSKFNRTYFDEKHIIHDIGRKTNEYDLSNHIFSWFHNHYQMIIWTIYKHWAKTLHTREKLFMGSSLLPSCTSFLKIRVTINPRISLEANNISFNFPQRIGWYWVMPRFGGSFLNIKRTREEGRISTNR